MENPEPTHPLEPPLKTYPKNGPVPSVELGNSDL